MENAIMQMVFGHMMRGKTSAGMRRNRSQKVSLEHMALFRLPGESQDWYLLRELQIAAGMKHLQLLLDSVVVWGVVSLSGKVSSSTINGYSIAPAFGADFHALITYTWVVPINDRSRKGR